MEKNSVASYFQLEKRAIKTNKLVNSSEIEREIESANENLFEVNFLNQEIIKFN